MSLYTELKRRNVLRVAAAYVVTAWLIIQVVETIFPAFGFGDAAVRIATIVLGIGLVPTLILAWVFELTPEGLKKDEDVDRTLPVSIQASKRLDRMILVVLALALAYFAFDKFVLAPAKVADIVEETAQQARSEALVESYGDKSIAVLPFVNMSADPEQEYFSDGISEELLNLLARVSGLRVTARSSSFSYKGKDFKVADVARDLNVGHVLEGSVRKSGNRIRITAQLIEARSDTHLWSETYDRDLVDIFAIQDEVAAAIVSELKVKLAIIAGKESMPHAFTTASSAAYDAYLQGRELINQRGRANTAAAANYFKRALRLDERFAPAHAQLGIAMILHLDHTPEERETAIAHFDRALELEPDLAEAHAGRALLAWRDQDFESSEQHARKALAVNPNYIDAMRWLANALYRLGRKEESEAIREQSLVIDPMSVVGRSTRAVRLNEQGRYDEAHEIADQLLADSQWAGYNVHIESYFRFEGKLERSLYWALKGGKDFDFNVMAAFQFAGLFDEARRFDDPYSYWTDVEQRNWDVVIAEMLKRMHQNPNTAYVIADTAEVLFLAGRIEEALPLYERLLDLTLEGQPLAIPWFELGQTMRMAMARRLAGDEEGAQTLAQIVRREIAAIREAGYRDWLWDLAEAMFATFEHDPDRAFTALESAIEHGLITLVYFDDPVYADLHGDPRFEALRQKLVSKLAAERDKILQLICFNNPVPDDWQPLPETCEGVENH